MALVHFYHTQRGDSQWLYAIFAINVLARHHVFPPYIVCDSTSRNQGTLHLKTQANIRIYVFVSVVCCYNDTLSLQAFAEQDLDINGDGFVTIQDVFVFLQKAWAGQQKKAWAGQHAATACRQNTEKSHFSRPRTLDDILRQRPLRKDIGTVVNFTGIFSREVEKILLTVAR